MSIFNFESEKEKLTKEKISKIETNALQYKGQFGREVITEVSDEPEGKIFEDVYSIFRSKEYFIVAFLKKHIKVYELLRDNYFPVGSEQEFELKIRVIEDYNTIILYLSKKYISVENIEELINKKYLTNFAWYQKQSLPKNMDTFILNLTGIEFDHATQKPKIKTKNQDLELKEMQYMNLLFMGIFDYIGKQEKNK